MLVIYDTLPENDKERLKREHPRGCDLVRAIECALSRAPLTGAIEVRAKRYAQIFTPEIEPRIEVRVSYLVGDGKVLIKVFKWDFQS